MSTLKKTPVKRIINKFECPICKEKFKNEISLNYHEMFHTEEERKASNGKNVSSLLQSNYKNSDSENDLHSPSRKRGKNKKVVRKCNNDKITKNIFEKEGISRNTL